MLKLNRRDLGIIYVFLSLLCLFLFLLGILLISKECKTVSLHCPETTQQCPTYNDNATTILQYNGPCREENPTCSFFNCSTSQCLEGLQECGYPYLFIGQACVEATKKTCASSLRILWGFCMFGAIVSGICLFLAGFAYERNLPQRRFW